MLNPHDSRNFGRTLGGLGLLLGGLLWIASSAVSPAWADDPSEYLAQIAESPTLHLVSGGLFLLGAIAFLPGLVATARLLRGRRVTVGQVGAYLLALGALVVGGVVFAINAVEVAMVDSAADRAEMVALSERGEESGAAMIAFFGTFLVGFVGGTVLLAIGLWTRRAVPIWSPLVLVASVPVLFVLGDGRWGSAVGMAVFVAALAPVALRILSLSDEQWERWQVLAEPHRRSAAAEDELGSPSTV